MFKLVSLIKQRGFDQLNYKIKVKQHEKKAFVWIYFCLLLWCSSLLRQQMSSFRFGGNISGIWKCLWVYSISPSHVILMMTNSFIDAGTLCNFCSLCDAGNFSFYSCSIWVLVPCTYKYKTSTGNKFRWVRCFLVPVGFHIYFINVPKIYVFGARWKYLCNTEVKNDLKQMVLQNS